MTSRPFLLRLLLPFTATTVLIVSICGAVIHWAGERATRMQQVRSIDQLVPVVRDLIRSDRLATAENRTLSDAARVIEARVSVIAGDGRVLFDSNPQESRPTNQNDRPEVIDARKSAPTSDVIHGVYLNPTTVYVARLVNPQDAAGAVVRLGYPRDLWVAMGTPVSVILIAGIICSLLAVTMLAVVLQRRWIAPINHVSRYAQRMAAGEWNLRVETNGADELRFFGEKLNALAGAAETQMSSLRHQRADLQALVDSLPDPILATDAQQRIILLNHAATTLFKISRQQATGNKAVNVVTDRALLSLLEGTVRPGNVQDSQSMDVPSTKQEELRLLRGGQKITYHTLAIQTTGGGALLVLRDISAMASTAQIKTDFVANASHELRTPIAAIKIAFETLRDVYSEDPAQTERCIQIIDGHLRRLEEMLRDLLDLSRVESADLEAATKLVRPSELFAIVRGTLGPLARQKGVELSTVALPGEDTDMFTDQRLLNLILKNLAENSIKFTPSGGEVSVTMEVGASELPPGVIDPYTVGRGARQDPDGEPNESAGEDTADGWIILTVRDTGIGIAPEHIERVFERFYQVDPARTGAGGRGMGLGLAIVKHAAHALRGTVKVESELGKGTTFTCVFPRQIPTEADAPVATA